MKFVIDESVSYSLVEELRKAGHNVVAIAKSSIRGIPDTDVFKITIKNKSILITRDYHFTNPVRFVVKKVEGIIYIRQGNLTCDEEIEIVMSFLMKYSLKQFRQKLVTLYKDIIKIR